MTTISREIEINAPKQEVWKVISKFGDICNSSPGVERSYVTSKQQEGVGATRHCDLTMNGATLEEKITEWIEGESLKIDVFELNNLPGVKTMQADFKIRGNGESSFLTANLHYTMKNFAFNIMNNLMLKKANEKLWNSVLAGHKKHIETGEIITKNTSLELDKVIVLD